MNPHILPSIQIASFTLSIVLLSYQLSISSDENLKMLGVFGFAIVSFIVGLIASYIINININNKIKNLEIRIQELEKSDGVNKQIDTSDINIRKGKYWTWVEKKFVSTDEKKASQNSITGKYLFFSKDSDTLLKIALNELKNGFDFAKISITAKGNDHVLCIYYKNDSRKREFIGKYNDVAYRYWKSDEDTQNGVYSQKFLES